VVFVLGHGMLPEQWERDSFRSACPKVCMAKWLTRVGERYGSRPEQMIYVPTGMDQDLFKVVTPFDQRPIDVSLLYGAPHPAKGWDVGVAALNKVRAERPDLNVMTFSVPPPTIPIPDWMDFTLDPDRQELADGIYNSSKVFIQPSHHEGFGLTALEAMACGSALVTTDNGGSEDYAIHDQSALVVPPRDPDAMAAAILRLLDDVELRRRISGAGSAVARTFRWERSGEIFERFLEDYVADPERFRQPPTADLTLAGPG
jgi:glycosyltransferase involved in cell wall biosynthesis